MSRKLELTFACGDYEVMRSLKEGIVRPEGIELTVLTDMAPLQRQVLLLTVLEGFTVADAATILGIALVRPHLTPISMLCHGLAHSRPFILC